MTVIISKQLKPGMTGRSTESRRSRDQEIKTEPIEQQAILLHSHVQGEREAQSAGPKKFVQDNFIPIYILQHNNYTFKNLQEI